MIKMIFYTLLTHYPHIDRANIVLTAMIVYIIIYIGVPEEWNTIALTSVAVLDYTLLNAQSWMNNAQGWVKNAQGWMKNAQGWVKNAQDKAEAWLNWLKIQLHINNTAASTKKKTRRHKKKHCNKKRVRFSEVNQYHEYKPWGGEVNTNLTTNFNINSNANTNSNANGNLNLNVPSWQLTPQQQLQQHLWKQYQAQMKASSGTKANSGMIDNRHLIVKDEEHDRFLRLYDESADSDQSSDLSNSEEGFDF